MLLSKGIILKSRYKIIKQIGGGGFGIVYLAEDTLKDSLWAVKEMFVQNVSEKDKAEILEQFWFEAKLLVKLSHPQLPVIEDFFEESGRYYIVMEYIQGKDLFDIIKSTKTIFPLVRLLEWSIKLCNVLTYLHNQTPHPVIFRDLKPENVMLSDTGEIKLIDFGISKLFDITRNTRNYAKAASPYFASPEQYGSQTTDTRSDIYSLGATLYYMYTAIFPADAIERIINEMPLTPPGKYNPDLPEDIDKLILKAMELNKDNRYQSIEEINRELASIAQIISPSPPITTSLQNKEILPEEEQMPSLSFPVYKGNQFIFIEASSEKPVKISGKIRSSEGDYKEETLLESAIISSYHYSVRYLGKDKEIFLADYPGFVPLQISSGLMDMKNCLPSDRPVKLELRDHKFSKISQGNFLFLDLYVTRHGKPLNGIVKIELLCKDLTVSSLRADAEEGFLKVKFDTKDYRGPFVIILTTRDRESDSLLISGVLPQEFMTAGMGHSFEISLHNLQGMEDSTRGIYYRRIEEKEKFFRLEEVSTSSGKIKLLEEFNKIQIVVINPIDGESTIYNFNDIKKDDLLDFEIYPPYSFIHLAFWKEKPFESWGIVLKPLQIKGLLKIKNNAYTGEELKIQIETDKPSSCLLIVSNKKPENFNPKKQLARDIYFNIKENSFNLHDGFIGTENLFCDYSVKNKKPFRPPVNISLFADSEEMEIIYSEVFPVDKVMEKTLLLPHKPGKWYVSSYILNDLDCLELCEEVLVREISITIDFDVPQIMGYGEKISGRIYFDTSEEAKLFINTPTDYFEGEVSGSGMTEFELLSPGDIRGELSFGSKKDIITHTICPAGMEKVILSSINLLSRGDIIEGDNLLIYPPNSLLLQLIRSMESFSFDSSEILSSKLSAMAIEYRLILSGVLSGDQKELEEKIYANLQILKKFFKEGFFSLWGEEPSVEVTVKVLTNMLSYQGLHFVSADRIIQSASKSLLERGIKSYPLTLLSSEFTPPSTRNINPILTYLYGPKLLRQQLVSLIKILAIKSHNFYYWKGDDFWGGTLEATCHALKVMHRAGEKEIFQKALNFIFTNIKNGTLNSTSDTLSLVELLSEVFLPSGSRAIVNGVETSFNDIFPVRGKVEVIEKNLIVRSDREEIVNYLEKQGEISFSIEVSSSHVIIGEILTIIIKPETRTLCPIARIFLPGNIDLLDLTPGIQYINLPVKGSTLEINALAVRNGTGKIRVFLEDFYRPDRTGVSESVEIVVGET